MKRLTVYLKRQPKIKVGDKMKVFNVQSFHHVSEHEAMTILASFAKEHISKYELRNYS